MEVDYFWLYSKIVISVYREYAALFDAQDTNTVDIAYLSDASQPDDDEIHIIENSSLTSPQSP